MVSPTTTRSTEPIRCIGNVPLYDNGAAPAHLRSKTHLVRVMCLELAPGQRPRAYVYTRYWGRLCALYDPAEAAPRRRTAGAAWAWRARRTCTRCGTQRPYALGASVCGDCIAGDRARAVRLQARTCRKCGLTARRSLAKDREFPFWHRCPPCRRERARERREQFAAGLEQAQRCPDCSARVASRSAALERYRKDGRWHRVTCPPCQLLRQVKAQEQQRARRAAEHRAIDARRSHVQQLEAWAAEALDDPATAVLDTETTGLHRQARVVELSIRAVDGTVLFDTLINPGEPIPPDATAIHGITDAMVAGAPSFSRVVPRLEAALRGRRVLIYNERFDTARLGYELELLYGAAGENLSLAGIRWLAGLGATSEDAMVPYSQWVGEWSERHGDYRLQALNGGHRALGDCDAVFERLEEMRAAAALLVDLDRLAEMAQGVG